MTQMFQILGHASVAGWGTMLQAAEVVGSIPDEVIGFFNWPNPSCRTRFWGRISL
jgi:hypothetical protein